MQKIDDGEWEVSVDVEPAFSDGRHIEVRETKNNNKFWVVRA
jgi:hypothetical protein